MPNYNNDDLDFNEEYSNSFEFIPVKNKNEMPRNR